MNQFQQELQSLNLNDYQSGNVVYWDQQQNQYPYYYIQDDARRCAGRCGGCVGCAGCFSCFNCWNWWII
ncbi:heterocycloanthracin/sonorensin family bacteriocin [Bacillus toyonensis]|uniref:heterocycloanthracin/sonorensin family bacteriocin n=1 Tax=Bacillus toyonensis TaxID=155322 RepID=UPI0021D1BDC7|nr:heterocycloanthracin/sonorensin family bacteriocin [Bacillus toyonensis]MCU5179698.1 heterocycloanthracin/sonorensin family bacteriocin [Bacillus toyonensis]